MLYHVSLEEWPIVVLGLRGRLLGANPIPHRLAWGVQFSTGAIYRTEVSAEVVFYACTQDSYDVTPPDTYSVQAPFRGVTDWYQSQVIENQVMAISVISVSSDSSEESVGTSAGRVILFGTIPTTIPDTTPTITLTYRPREEIDECIAYADSLRAGGIDARVVVEIVAREDKVTHPVVSDDIPEPA
ncbi:hypothetical protein Tco_1013969 [Tanacetum coccineum]